MKILTLMVSQLGSIVTEVQEHEEDKSKVILMNPFALSRNMKPDTGQVVINLIPLFVHVDIPIRVKKHHIIADSDPTENMLECYKKLVQENRNEGKISVSPENVVSFRNRNTK